MLKSPLRLCFTHVPKTGGTTVDNVLADGFSPKHSLRGLQLHSETGRWQQVVRGELDYVSGHIPATVRAFIPDERRITILREPRSLLASMVHFNRVDRAGTRFLDFFREAGIRYELYREYFSPGFDTSRLLADKQHGIANFQYVYADTCTVEHALATLARYDHVLDFEHLDLELKRLTMAFGLKPRFELPRLRAKDYAQDEAAVSALISDFDQRFYEAARSHFNQNLADVDAQYEAYVRNYPAEAGLDLSMHQSLALPLDLGVGAHWHEPESNDVGSYFRWSDGQPPTLDLPIRQAGWYRIHIYTHRHMAGEVTVSARRRLDGQAIKVLSVQHEDLWIHELQTRLPAPDWIHVKLDHGVGGASGGGDLRDRGLVLGRVLVRRTAG